MLPSFTNFGQPDVDDDVDVDVDVESGSGID